MTVEFALALASLAMFMGAIVVGVALCRAASLPMPHPVSPVDALEALGSEVDAVVFEFDGGWRNGPTR